VPGPPKMPQINATPCPDNMLNSMKASVRAVLVSSKNGVSLSQFLRDYEELSGEPLPYVKLGRTSPLDMLSHIPDVVQITGIGGGIILRGLSDSSTQHVDKLVSEQAASKKDRKSHRRTGGRSQGRSRNYPRTIRPVEDLSEESSEEECKAL